MSSLDKDAHRCDAYAIAMNGTSKGARALQSLATMPRKQRFKPSRKPQPTSQGVVSNPGIREPQNGVQTAQEGEKPAPVREQLGDSDEIIR